MEEQSKGEHAIMIFYFSATGNSEYAAKRIAKNLDDKTVNIARALRDDDMTYPLKPGETVGFVMPTYFFGIPVILHAFLYALQFVTKERHYTYLVLTCGGKTGAAGDMFAGVMRDNEYLLSAYYSVVMPDNYLLLYDVPKPEAVGPVLREADRELDAICADIRIRMGGNCDRHRGPVPGLFTKLAYPIYKRGRKTAKFYATDACVSCGLCERLCPCEAIRLENGRPRWVEDQCVLCLGCINRCPEAAIQYGKKTLRRGRYHNPET